MMEADIFQPSKQASAPQGSMEADSPPPASPSVDMKSGASVGIKLPDAVANVDMAQVSAKVDQFKKWTIGTFKNSKQQLLEHMGKVDKTVDSEFEQLCENLKDLHRRYGAVFAASRQFSQALTQLSVAEKLLGESLHELSMKEDSIKTVCETTSESMKKVGTHATSLDNCLRYFLSSMETMHAKTITDTLDTIYSTEGARIEYDRYRHELANITSQSTASPTAIQDAQTQAEIHRDKYEQLKADVRVKLRLLEENRVGVMSRQLEKLQTSLCAYYTGNAQLLASSVRELEALQSPQNSFLLQ